MQNFMDGLYTIVTKIQPLTYMLAAIMLVGCGVGVMIPSENIRNKSKAAIPWVAIGVGIILGATTFAQEFTGSFAF